MSRKIKLIWDFRGEAAEKTAQHHEVHLKEYEIAAQLPHIATGYENKTALHAIAFMVVDQANMIAVRDALKPHRGELYE